MFILSFKSFRWRKILFVEKSNNPSGDKITEKETNLILLLLQTGSEYILHFCVDTLRLGVVWTGTL